MEKKASGFSMKTWTRRFFVYSREHRTMHYFESAIGRAGKQEHAIALRFLCSCPPNPKMKRTFVVSSVEVEPPNVEGEHRFNMAGLRRGEAEGVLFVKTSSAESLQVWVNFIRHDYEREELERMPTTYTRDLSPEDLAVKLDHEERRSSSSHTHCMVMGCSNAIDEAVCGSGYCTEHEHHPLGTVSFEVVRQVLIDFRESTGYAGWTDNTEGWDKLETYTVMEELGESRYDGVNGVEVEDGKLVTTNLCNCNLKGTPHPLAMRTSPPANICAHYCSC
jgi:hypothetical protein